MEEVESGFRFFEGSLSASPDWQYDKRRLTATINPATNELFTDDFDVDVFPGDFVEFEVGGHKYTSTVTRVYEQAINLPCQERRSIRFIQISSTTGSNFKGDCYPVTLTRGPIAHFSFSSDTDGCWVAELDSSITQDLAVLHSSYSLSKAYLGWATIFEIIPRRSREGVLRLTKNILISQAVYAKLGRDNHAKRSNYQRRQYL